ncbi:hypothetical protein RHP47_06110 [Thermosynechococcus sp. QKsg1]|uniref:HMA2 domain-containing protein n=1 Tax=unclassified Thermosynechococcus TaxID=2622553 RepID=UPI00122E3247|nr:MULTISPECIES: hypothetical protein [unclassified Thermosynechococcus]QEQ00988.1 hypothetical protein FFX45_06090 [Thermosynechococcus sp. CL-1]WJI25252.1 hypothetical protein MZ909_06110 [Thermosynechococcus sp. B0]WJI27780.1 hypothetical protein M0644_06175 [Thermosynechococcus sp. B1]WJI30314.1 hypothetical protein M0646_06180 [Thermosynechococcus sp. B3]WKT84896.1 hypothetical protein QYC28_06130 [Thermosynechococcus sp. HY596]
MATAETAPIAEVMHLTGDRLRLRIQELKTDAAFRDSLSAYLKTRQGIKSVHVNPLAASITIEYHLEQITPLQLLAAIQFWGDVQIIGQGNKGLQNLTRAFDLEPEEVGNKLTSMGGFLMGGYVGDILGGMVGGTAGGLFMGPAGAVMGVQVGTFVGGVIGARLGMEATEQITQLQFTALEETPERVAKVLEIRTGDKIGGTAGEIAGGLAGQVVLGPVGETVGRVVGNMVGAQLGEDLGRQLAAPSPEEPPPPSLHLFLEWWVKTSQAFTKETLWATLGGMVARAILGPQAEAEGIRAGTRISRHLDMQQPNTAAKEKKV